MKKIFVFASYLIISVCTYSQVYGQVISDRLIIEINKNSYTQRQMELYIALRSALTSKELTFVNQANWSQQMDFFRREMVMEQEAQRLSSAQPNRKTVQSGLSILEDRQKKSPEFASFLKRMQADEATQRRVLASIIRVRVFLSSKERQYSQDPGRLEEKTELDPKAEWYVKLEQRTPYRAFEGAREYVQIEPAAGFGLEKKL